MKIKLTDDHVGQPLLNILVEWDGDDTSTAWRWARLTGTPYRQLVSLPCDGPCGKTYPYTELAEFGICEHSICANCLRETKKCPMEAGCLDQLLNCKLILIEKEGKRLLKRTLSEEWYASQTVASTRQLLASMAKKPLVRLMAGPLISKEDAKPVPEDAVRLVDLLDHGQSSLVFVAVFEEKKN